MKRQEEYSDFSVSRIYEVLQYGLNNYDTEVEIVENHRFNLKSTINRIELYLASKFESGDTNDDGTRKYFFNRVIPQCGNATKNIDLDRRDINVIPVRGESDAIKAMIYQSELKEWLSRTNFGLLLNKISDNLPKYGSVILKKVGDKVEFKPIKYMIFDPAVSNSPDNYNMQSSYIIEKHVFQPMELQAMVEKGWNEEAVQKLVDDCVNNDGQSIVVYELYSTFNNEDLEVAGKGISKGVAFVGSVMDRETSKKMGQNTNVGVCLYRAKIEEFPYKKIDYLSIEGRSLGLGIVEMLFDMQEYTNLIENGKADSIKFGNKQVFQSRSQTLAGNIMTDLINGDILQVDSEIQPIDTRERNLQIYQLEEQIIQQYIKDLANSQDILMGANLPSRTPFRVAAMQQQNAAKYFDFVRQNIGMFLEEVITEWVLPQFDKQKTQEHIFYTYDPDEISTLVERDINRRINEAVKKYVLENGFFPSKEEIDMIKTAMMTDENKKGKLFADIMKGFLDFEKDIQIDITGEKTNKQAEAETVVNMLQLLGQNPQIMQDPRLMKMFRSMAQAAGVDPLLIPNAEQPAPQAQMPSLTDMGMGSMNPEAALPNQQPIQ